MEKIITTPNGQKVLIRTSQEELDEIEALEQEEEDRSWINDDDIDFDEYEEYYDEEN